MYPIIFKELQYIVSNSVQDNELPVGLASVVDAVLGAQGLNTDHSTVRSLIYKEHTPAVAQDTDTDTDTDTVTATDNKADKDKAAPIYIDLYPFVYGRTIGNKDFIETMHLAVAEEYLAEVAAAAGDKPDYTEVAAVLFSMRYRFFVASVAGARGYIFNKKWEPHQNLSAAIQSYAAGGLRIWLRNCFKPHTTNTVVRALVTDVDKYGFSGARAPHMAERIISLLYAPKLEEKLGVYSHKISFLNGIVDLSLPRMKLRADRPSDYSAMNTNIPFKRPTAEAARKLAAILKDVFPEDEEREYFLDKYAGVLSGYNRFRELVISLGGGSNSKSFMQSVIERAFGDYCATAPTDLFCSPLSSSDKPAPALVALKGKLIATASEPPLNKPIIGATVKALTGNDRVSARGLYKDQGHMGINAQFFIICNKFPQVDQDDKAYRERMRYITYRTTFVDSDKVAQREEADARVRKSAANPSALPPSYIRARKIGIEEQAGELAVTLAYELVKRYITRVRDMTKQVVPCSILDASSALSVSHSTVGEFMEARLDGPAVLSTPCAVPMTKVYGEYKEYMLTYHNNARLLDLSGLTTAIECAVAASNVIERGMRGGDMLLCHRIKALSVA